MGWLNELLACPVCQGTLEAEPALRCAACRADFPSLGRIPVVTPDPRALIASWQEQLATFTAETEAAERHLWAELVAPELAPSTRLRLRTVAEAMPLHRQLVLELFRDVGLEPSGGASGHSSTLLDYVALIHRDFGWMPEVNEVAPALAALVHVCPPRFRLGRTLVLGAGTGRLAWDLALHFAAEAPIVALDLNPLPLLVTERLLAGRDVELYELPGHPRRAAHAAVRRTLRPPAPSPPNLHLLLADGLRPPLRTGAFDTVITPWFLDQVPRDLAAFLPELARLLVPGGSWLHAGPFVYAPAHTKPAHRYSAEEFLELAERAGFHVSTSTYEPASYLCSPLSTQGRRETVLHLHASKGAPLSASPEPEWLAPSWTGAIPRLALPANAELPLPILHRTLLLLDGARTATDVARRLVADGELADDGNAEVVVRGCLRVLWSAAR